MVVFAVELGADFLAAALCSLLFPAVVHWSLPHTILSCLSFVTSCTVTANRVSNGDTSLSCLAFHVFFLSHKQTLPNDIWSLVYPLIPLLTALVRQKLHMYIL